MGDAVGAQTRDLLPHFAQELIADLVATHVVEAPSLDHFVGDEHRVVAHLGDGPHAWRRDADVARLQCDERLVLHQTPQ